MGRLLISQLIVADDHTLHGTRRSGWTKYVESRHLDGVRHMRDKDSNSDGWHIGFSKHYCAWIRGACDDDMVGYDSLL